ncbi:MAG: hypothetical protein K1X75_02215 [Leptospirales bacterium]|nr:hypothetical protein [Leptospirales bacterium]
MDRRQLIWPTRWLMLCAELPCHPLLVHLPLGLAFLIPVAALAAAFLQIVGHRLLTLWNLLLLLHLLLVASLVLTKWSGEQAAPAVEPLVAQEALERHAFDGGLLLAAASVALLVWLVAWRKGFARGAVSALLLAASTFPGLALALRTGSSGGALVYVHGSYRAWIQSNPMQQPDSDGAGAAKSPQSLPSSP